MSEQNTRNTRLAAALAYARRGWAVHPVRPGDKRPLLKDWPHQATTDPKTIEEWWARWPAANVALACGPSRLFVVDLDVKAGAAGPASWANLAARLGLGDLLTPTGRTPSGGRHLFFAAPDPPLGNSTGRLGPGIDTRGEGGYVLLPPSARGDGKAYTWEISPTEQDPCPLQVARLVRRRVRQLAGEHDAHRWRHGRLSRAAAQARRLPHRLFPVDHRPRE